MQVARGAVGFTNDLFLFVLPLGSSRPLLREFCQQHIHFYQHQWLLKRSNFLCWALLFPRFNTKFNPSDDNMLVWPHFKEGIVLLGFITTVFIFNSCLNNVNWKHSLLICSQSQDKFWVIKGYLSASITAEGISLFSEPMWKHKYVKAVKLPLCRNTVVFLSFLYCDVLSFFLIPLVILANPLPVGMIWQIQTSVQSCF